MQTQRQCDAGRAENTAVQKNERRVSTSLIVTVVIPVGYFVVEDEPDEDPG